MAALSPQARAVLEAGRKALQPTADDRMRLEAMLDARLGAATAALGPDVMTPLRSFSWRMPTVALGVALVGGAALFAWRPWAHRVAVTASAPVSQPAVQTSAVSPAAAAPATPAAPAAATLTSAAAITSASVPALASARPTQDPLAQEVALLSRATSYLRAGRAADALKTIAEHQRRFPSGVLGVERSALRAQALCSLKRVAEGRAELARLGPQTPAAGRAKQVCDAASAANSDP